MIPDRYPKENLTSKRIWPSNLYRVETLLLLLLWLLLMGTFLAVGEIKRARNGVPLGVELSPAASAFSDAFKMASEVKRSCWIW